MDREGMQIGVMMREKELGWDAEADGGSRGWQWLVLDILDSNDGASHSSSGVSGGFAVAESSSSEIVWISVDNHSATDDGVLSDQ